MLSYWETIELQGVFCTSLIEFFYFQDDKYTGSAELERDEGNKESTDANILEKKNAECLEANIVSNSKDESCEHEHLSCDELSSSTCADGDLYDSLVIIFSSLSNLH